MSEKTRARERERESERESERDKEREREQIGEGWVIYLMLSIL